MIKLKTLLEGHKNDFGCVMLYFKFPQMATLHKIISPDDIYTDPVDDSFGLEDKPHTTLLFGLHGTVTTENVKAVIDKYEYGPCIAYNPSLFSSKKYDVLKFDVKGDNLAESNADLKEFPFTSDFPDYHPHMTIAYLKPGTGEKYAKHMKTLKFELVPSYAVYSKINGDKDILKIKVKPIESPILK